MASAIQRVATPALRCAFRPPVQIRHRNTTQCQRFLATSAARGAKQRKKPMQDLDFSGDLEHQAPTNSNDPDSERVAELMSMMQNADRSKQDRAVRLLDLDNKSDEITDGTDLETEITSERLPKEEVGFWAEGEPDAGPDEDFHGDDISSIAHEELETHRELREYARIIAWELPSLGKLAKPFEPPEFPQILRFRYTTYMGETHPAAHKVVVEFRPDNVPDITQPQIDKLIKLAGARYNPTSESIKMSCEMFDSQMQNKRWLTDTANKLVSEAKDGEDDFADVPFDFRHHKPKVMHGFPQAWVLTEERQKELAAVREQRLLADQKRAEDGKLLDGSMIIGGALAAPGAVAQPVPQYIEPPEWYRGRRRFVR